MNDILYKFKTIFYNESLDFLIIEQEDTTQKDIYTRTIEDLKIRDLVITEELGLCFQFDSNSMIYTMPIEKSSSLMIYSIKDIKECSKLINNMKNIEYFMDELEPFFWVKKIVNNIDEIIVQCDKIKDYDAIKQYINKSNEVISLAPMIQFSSSEAVDNSNYQTTEVKLSFHLKQNSL